ncbi:MAG: hypothetical protein V3S41_04250, partial [Spirochaetia bacterium]
MHLKLPHSGWVALAVLALTGCHQGVNLFQVEAGSRSEASGGLPNQVSLSLREKPPQQETAEGYILTESRSTPLYTLRATYLVPPGGESWAFTLSNMDRPLTVVIYADDGRAVATRSIARPDSGPDPGAIDIVIVVSIPGSIGIRSFQIVDDGPVNPATIDTVRLIGVSTEPPSGASQAGATEID